MHDCQSEGKPIDGSTMTSASVILPFLVIVMSGEEEGCNFRRWLAPGNNPLCGCGPTMYFLSLCERSLPCPVIKNGNSYSVEG